MELKTFTIIHRGLKDIEAIKPDMSDWDTPNTNTVGLHNKKIKD